MRERRIDEVTIAGSRDASTVTIPWASRTELLERLRLAGGADGAIRAFEAVGTSAPVKLSKSARGLLLVIVEAWLVEVSLDGLPEGILELRNALHDERIWGELDSAQP